MRKLWISLFGIMSVVLFACTKEQSNQDYVPLLPSTQKLKLAQIGYALHTDLETPANQNLLNALDTFAFYLSKPGIPAPWIQEGNTYSFVTGVYEYSALNGAWQRTGEDTCMRLKVNSSMGELDMALSSGTGSSLYSINNKQYRFPNGQSIQFKQDEQILMSMQSSFRPSGVVGTDSLATGVVSELSMLTSELQASGTIQAGTASADVSMKLSKESRMLLDAHINLQYNQSWDMDLNVMDMCYIRSSVSDLREFERSMQDCYDRFPRENGNVTEGYCRAVRDSIRKYIPSYLNFDHSQTPVVQLIPEYAYSVDSQGKVIYDMFPVMRFSDGSQNALGGFVSYTKLEQMWSALIHLYAVGQ